MKTLSKVLSAAVVGCVLVGCAKSEDSSSSPSEMSVQELAATFQDFSKLEGNWSEGCASKIHSVLSFANGRYEQKMTLYNEEACQTVKLVVTIRGVYTTSVNENGLNEINLELQDYLMRPVDAELVKANNQGAFCSITHWEANRDQSVAGLTCGSRQMPKAGLQGFDIYSIELNSSNPAPPSFLRFGETSETLDGSEAAKRPTSLADWKIARQP